MIPHKSTLLKTGCSSHECKKIAVVFPLMKLIIMSHSETSVLTSVELLLMHTDGLKNDEQQELHYLFQTRGVQLMRRNLKEEK